VLALLAHNADALVHRGCVMVVALRVRRADLGVLTDWLAVLRGTPVQARLLFDPCAALVVARLDIVVIAPLEVGLADRLRLDRTTEGLAVFVVGLVEVRLQSVCTERSSSRSSPGRSP